MESDRDNTYAAQESSTANAAPIHARAAGSAAARGDGEGAEPLPVSTHSRTHPR